MRLRCARCGCYVSAEPIIEHHKIGDTERFHVHPCRRCLREARREALTDAKLVEKMLPVMFGIGVGGLAAYLLNRSMVEE